MTKRQYIYATFNTTTAFRFITATTSAISNTTFIATACKDEIIKKKSQKYINIQVIKRIYRKQVFFSLRVRSDIKT